MEWGFSMISRRNLLAMAGTVTFAGVAIAQSGVPVVLALGASNTAGRGGNGLGVERGKAYPAKLQALLGQRGVRARVQNAGVAGDTTSGMLRRLPGLLNANTRVVVLQSGGNDGDAGTREANIAHMKAILDARKIRMVRLDRILSIAGSGNLAADGIHFNEAGHQNVAEYLVDSVASALQ
jgi:acyl-CoA thioesterase I